MKRNGNVMESLNKSVIIPKFEIGQEVYYLYQNYFCGRYEIKKGVIGAIETFINDIDEKSVKYMIYRFKNDCDLYECYEYAVFLTRQEAINSLEVKYK